MKGGGVGPRLAPVQAAFSRDRSVTSEGTGFGSGALKVEGRIFAMTSSKGEFVAKLPRERVDERSSWIALAREAREFVAGGKPRRGNTR